MWCWFGFCGICHKTMPLWVQYGILKIQHFLFLLKISIPLYHSTGAMIHQPLSPDGVNPKISSSMRLLVLCFVCLDLFVINYCLFIFSKNAFLWLTTLTNATPAFSMLWFFMEISTCCISWKNIYMVLDSSHIFVIWLQLQEPGILLLLS